MAAWTVRFVDDTARGEVDALPDDARARFARIAELIQSHGLENVREPYVRHLHGKLWEIRMKGKNVIARSIYVTQAPHVVVVLHTFVKKQQRTPTGALSLATARAKRYGLL